MDRFMSVPEARRLEGLPTIIERDRSIPDELREWTPKSRLGVFALSRIMPRLPEDLALQLKELIAQTMVLETSLRLRKMFGPVVLEDHGVVSRRVVTTTGVGFLVDAWQNSVELEIMKYHGTGSGTTAAVVGDTALETEFTTETNPNSTRATGTLTEGASANIFKSVGTNTYDASVAVTEHGILSQAATGGGVLWDRHVFSAINLVSAESLESTYEATFSAGG